MAAIASFSVASETDNANRLADPENLYIPGFKGIMRKKVKKKQSVARWLKQFQHPRSNTVSLFASKRPSRGKGQDL